MKIKPHWAGLVAVTAVAGVVLASQSGVFGNHDPEAVRDTTDAIQSAEPVEAERLEPFLTMASGGSSANSNSLDDVLYFTSPSLSRFWRIASDRKSLRLSTYEVFPGGVLGEVHQEVSTSFSIQDIAPRSGSELYVGGFPVRGGFLIEQWNIPEVVGSTTGRLDVSMLPIGTPTTGATPYVYIPSAGGGQGGGVQVPLASRARLPSIARSLFAEDHSVRYKAIGADPEGRFVLVITDTAELRQYLPGGALDDYILLADAGSVPDLSYIEGLFNRVQHAVFGRVWFLSWYKADYPDGTPMDIQAYQTLVLVDANNDGIFEEITPHPMLGTTIELYTDETQWLDDFIAVQ